MNRPKLSAPVDSVMACDASLEARTLRLFVETLLREPAPAIDPPVAPPLPDDDSRRCDPAPAWSARAVWEGAEFDVLLFRAGPLPLAIPMPEVQGIVNVPTRLGLSHNTPDWVLGTFNHRDGLVTAIDTQHLLTGESGDHGSADLATVSTPGERHGLLIAGGRWVLVCAPGIETRRVEPDMVRWRKSRTNRPWYAGVITPQMNTLLDLRAVATLIGTIHATNTFEVSSRQ